MRAIWSRPGLLALLLVIGFPFYATVFPRFDGWLFPVTSKVELLQVQPTDGGVTVRMAFSKLRDCEYLGSTMDRDGMPVDFYPVVGGQPVTLATGRHLSRPWFVGSTDIGGLHLRFLHRCSPLWLTVTDVYP